MKFNERIVPYLNEGLISIEDRLEQSRNNIGKNIKEINDVEFTLEEFFNPYYSILRIRILAHKEQIMDYADHRKGELSVYDLLFNLDDKCFPYVTLRKDVEDSREAFRRVIEEIEKERIHGKSNE